MLASAVGTTNFSLSIGKTPLTPEELLPLSQNYVASIHAGDFELKAKKDQDCEHCSFMTLCRIHAIPPIRGEVGPDEEGT